MTIEYEGKTITIHDSERQPTEIWSRCMGYYRPITIDAYKNTLWNTGKVGEHRERKFFRENKVSQIIGYEKKKVCEPGSNAAG